jgi:hypothetical protein
MEATRLRAHLLRFAFGMLKMQFQEPGVFEIGCEVVRGSQRRFTKVANGVSNFWRQLIDMHWIKGRICDTYAAATRNRRRHLADETQ